MLRLTAFVGSRVRSTGGDPRGRLVDLTVELGDAHPVVRRLVIRQRRGRRSLIDWATVRSFERDEIQIVSEGAPGEESPRSGELCLVRDVLDTQVVDVGGRRMARVADVVLSRSEDVLCVLAVDVSASGVWRRLGMTRMAERSPERAVDWADLHLTSVRGHALALATPAASVHRLGVADLAGLVARLPPERGAEVLNVVAPDVAAAALSATRPRVGARLLGRVAGGTAAAVVERMPTDDAAALLRALPAGDMAAVLRVASTDRAAILRRLLEHRADTAGGLMNTDIRTARVGESVDVIRARLAHDPPALESMASVFVVADDGRPVGSFEPTDLLAGRLTPTPVPVVPVDLPIERVIDLFAVHDFLALPVVDHEGRIVGAVAADDVLEELLAERLPGQNRFARIRRRHHGQSSPRRNATRGHR